LVALSRAEPDPATAAGYRRQAAEVARFLADHLEEPALRVAFLNQPEVRRVLEVGD
jgi:hypothetical protein